MNIHCFQHLAFENPGTILDWALANNHALGYTCFHESNFSLPDIASIDALLIMGGHMNVKEEAIFPWLKQEKEFIRRAIDAGKKIIGICLGAQLVAAALGSNVFANSNKEIGFFPVHFTPAALEHPFFSHFKNPSTVFHWHGDTFDLPPDAALIASTAVCKNQAYLIGNNVLGLQFHFEMNETVLESMLLHDGHELDGMSVFVTSKEQIRAGYLHLLQNKKDMFALLDKFFAPNTQRNLG
jgi:GMP synthase-like glutamine amidotransferase